MHVIVLNGTSSAGKSTLASVLQARPGEAGECWIVMGIDASSASFLVPR